MPDLNDQRHAQFLRLFAVHEPAIRTFVRALAPSLADTAEILQETAVTLWEKFGEYDASRDFRSWAFGIARYKTLGFLRDRQRDRHVFDDELLSQLADDTAAMEQRHSRQRDALDHCLQKLPPPQRELALAAYTKGTRMDELAARRGQTAMALYKLLQRIRQTLMECVRRTLAREDAA
jgi:RNA polymerase sigma-70 factor (ECF subfamily)